MKDVDDKGRLTAEGLARAKELCAKATAGPWEMQFNGADTESHWAVVAPVLGRVGVVMDTLNCDHAFTLDEQRMNAVFAFESRTLLPAALASLEDAEKRVRELETKRDHYPFRKEDLGGKKIEYRESDGRHYVYGPNGEFLWSGRPAWNAVRCVELQSERDAALKLVREMEGLVSMMRECVGKACDQAYAVNATQGWHYLTSLLDDVDKLIRARAALAPQAKADPALSMDWPEPLPAPDPTVPPKDSPEAKEN